MASNMHDCLTCVELITWAGKRVVKLEEKV